MKIIISHDVDHITAWEHTRDLIIPKFIIRSSFEFLSGKISVKEYLNRCRGFISNKWQNLEELMTFDKEGGIPATFFVGVAKGKGLSYNLADATYWIKRIVDNGFDVGLHGIAYQNYREMQKEYEIFIQASGLEKFGIRIHYLKLADCTLECLSKLGYLYDATTFKSKKVIKIGNLLEFPVHIMDTDLFCRGGGYQKLNLKQVMDKTKNILDQSLNKDVKYFTLLFHDRYFCDSYKAWRDWYIWVVDQLKESGFKFISYQEALSNEEVLLSSRGQNENA